MKIPSKILEDMLIYICLTLILIGLMLIGSIDSFQFKSRNIVFQTMWIFVSIIAFFIFSRIKLEKMRKFSLPLLLLGLTALALLFVPGFGKTINGSTRWYNLGKFTFQPSNIAKIVFIFYLAHFCAKNQDIIEKTNPKYFIQHFLFVILAFLAYVGLIYVEPDLSTAGILFLVFLSMLFVVKVKLRTIALLVATVIIILTVLLSFGPSYRRERNVAFLKSFTSFNMVVQDHHDPLFHPRESLIALSNGHITGRGSEEGKAKLYYLPFAHSDYIFSILGEEYGFIGGLLLLVIYLVLLLSCFTLAQRAHNFFYSFLIAGLAFGIAYNMIVNIAVAMCLLPSTGVTLPFISYGGTALVFDSIAIALIINASKRDRKEIKKMRIQYA